ncbi:hypothetical protein HO133_004065 [Letharia lupina]|uniref:POPLD-domain-containing protein n=1 Tax=Letharia lupina TaxID=560253 RepID=A0A8H6CAH8_9LECA|nr:uncharacterized protein HO133_004065 [Letharia lupina]KAF6219596.1 hypothetical protein HO133_004065 [Letharia lupina]
MAPSGPLKRKQSPHHSNPPPSAKRAAKRVKTSSARNILAQTSDKALSKNGDLDVSAFVKAREFEIKAMAASMGASKNSLSTRAFQQVPKDLRRRTASHNVKRVPKRLRARAAKEMKEDNAPTVTARRRKPTPHQRLRLEKAKKLKELGALTKKKRAAAKTQKPGETDPEKMVAIVPRSRKLKKDTLAKPANPPAKFRKRQVHKQWLPTHLYHAKRAHMTPPKEPLWRFAIPLTPTDKCYRPTHRAASLRGCVAWDTSYISTIGIEGVEPSLLGLLKGIGVEENMLIGKREAKWRRGTRGWEGWIRERDGERMWISRVGIVWCFDASPAEDLGKSGRERQIDKEKGTELETEPEPQSGDGEGMEVNLAGKDGAEQVVKQEKKRPRRKLLMRVHPSAFLQVWSEILKVAKIQRPQVMVEDLRFEIGSIEIVGPGSTEALIGALHPSQASEQAARVTAKNLAEDEWVDVGSAEEVWPQLAAVTNPACLPTNVMLGFNISDPRLHYPPRTVPQPVFEVANETLPELLSSWPPDQAQATPDMFDRTKRLTASRQLASQKAINRRKGEALPGGYPNPTPKDPKIPVLLLASRPRTKNGQGTWTLLLPWDCVLPVWYSLMHYPLSTGGNPRFGGLQEKKQVSFEQGVPWFPGDYPGTKAGYQWELMERERKKQEWERRPKGKRTEWNKVDLGEGRKGELGMGWACDWDRLFQGPSSPARTEAAEKYSSAGPEKAAKDATKPAPPPPKDQQPEQIPTEAPNPPLKIHHLPNPPSTTPLIPPTALSPVHITLLTAGHPTRSARIYRLPTSNPEMRAKWLALANPPKASKGARHSRPPPPKHVPQHARVANNLAASLLSGSVASPETGLPKAGEKEYPPVPDEVDLIGFVTTGNYNLGEGRCEAIGNVAVARVVGADEEGKQANARKLCIIREAGQGLGRLARWEFCVS